MRRIWVISILPLILLGFEKSSTAYTVDELFQNFKKAYEQSKNFSSDFEETTLRDEMKSVAKGRLFFSKPNQLRKEYTSRNNPKEIVQLIVLDGDYSWSYTPMLEQVNKMKWDSSSRKELIPGIGLSLEGVEDNYEMKHVPDEVVNQKGIYQIELTPKPHLFGGSEGQTSREVLSIWVQSSDWLPVQFGYSSDSEEGSSLRVIVSMTNLQRDQKLDDALFRFTPPPDVEVIDISTD